MKVLITGSKGFVAKNLKLFLNVRPDIEFLEFSKEHKISELCKLVNKVDFIFHLAGVNRAKDVSEFSIGNENLTQELCSAIKKTNRKIPILYSSSTQASLKNTYGISKKNVEDILFDLKKNYKIPIYIFRLPNIFGKWCKPNYNSVVATFCYNIARNIPIHIKDPNDIINLVYIDDVIKHFIEIMENEEKNLNNNDVFKNINFTYKITVGNLAKQIYAFNQIRDSSILEPVGTGLVRSLYSTYVSYLPKQKFSYTVKANDDLRGRFVEMLKTKDSGQFSYFTVSPNATRGEHYHHSKTEKFLVIKGSACFNFYNLDTKEKFELNVNGDKPEIVESIPGWAHNIKNNGNDEVVVMLWANENFNPNNPDTYSFKL